MPLLQEMGNVVPDSTLNKSDRGTSEDTSEWKTVVKVCDSLATHTAGKNTDSAPLSRVVPAPRPKPSPTLSRVLVRPSSQPSLSPSRRLQRR